MGKLITTLLSKDVVTGENIQKWKSNLNVVVVSERMRFVPTDNHPPVPTANSTLAVKDEFNHWVTSTNKAMGYILASMSNVL